MPELTLLYSVAGAVVIGLVLWVAFVLVTVKEPWARALPVTTGSGALGARQDDVNSERTTAKVADANPPVEADQIHSDDRS
jgi:hypothetical protein